LYNPCFLKKKRSTIEIDSKKWGQAPFQYERGRELIGTSEMGPGPIFLYGPIFLLRRREARQEWI
jgi:hypothetical protein